MNKIVTKLNGFEIILWIRDEADQSVVGEIFNHHEYRVIEDVIKSATKPIIDVGAHAGFFSLYARAFNPAVRIVAIEPDLNNISQLKLNFKANKTLNIDVLEGAVAQETGRRQLQIFRDNHNHRLVEFGSNIDTGVTVNSWSLSDILKKCIINDVSLVKIDVEGGEYEIFEGLKESDFGKIKYFFIEYHNNSKNRHEIIENILRENGFGVRIFPSKFDKKMGFIFAINKRK